jgi:glutaredoxin-related protein
MKQVNEIIYSAVKNQSILILLKDSKKLKTPFSSKILTIVESSNTNEPFSLNYLCDRTSEI